MRQFLIFLFAVIVFAGAYVCAPVPAHADGEQSGQTATPQGQCSPTTDPDVVAANPLRIERSPRQSADAEVTTSSAEPEDDEYRCCITKAPTPLFPQVLEGFSRRWLHRLGTPVACPIALCNGSCAQSEAPCELPSSRKGESSCCAAMPAHAHP